MRVVRLELSGYCLHASECENLYKEDLSFFSPTMTIHHFTAGYHLPFSSGTGELYVPNLPLMRSVSFQQGKKLGQTTSISISNCNQTAPLKALLLT